VSGTRTGLEVGAFRAGAPEVIGRVDANATTDFGAPGAPGLWDDEPLDGGERTRLVGLLRSSWDDIADHVREAERTSARKAGVRVPPRTPWDEQRNLIADTLLGAGTGTATSDWPPRYFIRRTAWHALDHARELEDKSR